MSTKYLLDTDIIIYWLKGIYPQIDKKIKELSSKFAISTITVAELYFGAYNSNKRDNNILIIDRLISKIQVIELDIKAGQIFGKIKAQLKSRGKIISDSDLFIASIAISNNMTLVSNNERHFLRIRQLKTEKWI